MTRAALLRAEILGAEAAESRLGAEWLQLAFAVEDATCFMLPAFFRAWRQVLAEEDEAQVIAAFDGDGLIGVLPLMRGRVWRGPSCAPRIDYASADRRLSPGGRRPFLLRQLASVVSWPAASLRPTLLAAPVARAAAVRSMAATMLAAPGNDVIVLPVYLGEDAATWTAAFREAGGQPWLHALNRDVLTLDTVRPFDEVVARQPGKFRQNIRRARAAADRLGISFEVHAGRAEVARRFDRVARAASRSWKQAGEDGRQTALPYAGRQQAFFETLLDEEGTGLVPLLAEARMGDDAIAVLLAARAGATVTAFVTFRDDRGAAASPGLLLFGALIDWCVAQGVRRFDINATQDWLRHLSDTRRTLANLVVFTPTLRGGAFSLISRAARWAHARRSGDPAPPGAVALPPPAPARPLGLTMQERRREDAS